MKRPLAYLTAAWSGEPDVDMELAAHYCRLTYEAGFSPICPLLYLPLFLNDSVPEEHKAGIDMRRDMLRRSHTLIAVSYTHLDVYKRQVEEHHRKVPRGIAFHTQGCILPVAKALLRIDILICQIHACLLYTSRCV